MPAADRNADDGRTRGRTQGRTQGHTQAGFTLIEIMVVLVIMALTATIVLTQGTTHHPGVDLRAAAADVAQGLRLARSQATATDRPVAFVVDVASRSYRIGDTAARPLGADVTLHVVTVAGDVAGRDAAITFAPDGSSSGGRIDLATGQRTVSIAVDWLTGRVSVADDR